MLQLQEQRKRLFLKMNGSIKMLFIRPSEFDFVKHWNYEDKKFIASFLSKISKRYLYIQADDFKSFIRYKIFLEYKKHLKNLKVNPSLMGKLRMGLYRLNKKELDNVIQLRDIEFMEDFHGNLSYFDEEEGSICLEIVISDIGKICCKRTAKSLLKKINREELTRWEYALLKRHREKIIEYLAI